MENLIVYQADNEAKKESNELFGNKGNLPYFADNISEFISMMSRKKLSKISMYVHNLSDMRVLCTVRPIHKDIDIILIVSPHLYEIIEPLRVNNIRIMKNIMDILDD